MKATSTFSRILLVAGLILGGGCAQEGPLSTDAKIATRQINELIPRGTPEARARKVLTGKGFALSRLNSDGATNYLLVATHTKSGKTWQVGVIIINGQAVAGSVTISDGS